jgi:tryptophanyl-tRNA synthetase
VFKQKLADIAVAVLGPIAERMRHLLADPAELDRLLARGVERAGALSEAHMREVKGIVGFWTPGA